MTSNSTVQLNFGERLLAWWDVHGRRDLPWQQQRTPYRVWVSEIMLQQTRVETATAYYQRFMQRLPRLEHLANAELDDVLSLWSGLGYYARARNLHKTAIIVRDQYQGEFPDDLEQLEALPGIGRSTAAAIRAQAFGRRAAILDGNVKRVMARHAAIDGWPGQSRVAKQLWAESELRTPEQRPADYTQAIMDLGATLCSRSSPDCTQCPVQQDCKAHLQQRQHELPAPKPRKTVPLKTQVFDLLRNHNGHILMQRRPPSGIWGGLWCLPEHGQIELPRQSMLPELAPIQHAFSHFKLTLEFRHHRIRSTSSVQELDCRWLSPVQWLNEGIPRPIRQLLETLIADTQQPLPYTTTAPEPIENRP